MRSARFLRALLLCGISALLPATPVHAAPGDLDALNPNITGPDLHVYATAVQPDGKILVAGNFMTIGGRFYNGIARLNADGTPDTGFAAGSDMETGARVRSVAVQADGKILFGGLFQSPTFFGNNVARLNADGSRDLGFLEWAQTNGTVYSMAVQRDGKILCGGSFSEVNQVIGFPYLMRMDAAGGLDQSFIPFIPNVDTQLGLSVRSVAVQTDGRILLGGQFISLGGTARSRIARVEATGALDMGFDPNANGLVHSVAVQADGRILLGGNFTAVGGTVRNRIARVNADGTLDTGFNPNANSFVYSVAVQADGKVLLGGVFTTVGGIARNGIARVNADGTLDTGFDPNANNVVNCVAVQADGKVLLGGDFTTLRPNGAGAATTRTRFARLLNDPATQTLTATDTSHALWTRGGAAPDLTGVTFEVSTNGGSTWGTPIAGTRVGPTVNWHATDLSLPASGQLRARGRPTGTSGLIEQVTGFSGLLLPPGAEIVVEQPAGTGLTDFISTAAFGPFPLGMAAVAKTFTVRNGLGSGGPMLTGLAVTSDNAEFAVNTTGFPASLAPGASATFTVTFTPVVEGAKTATLSIASSDADETPFEVTLTGRGNSFTTDTDGDGLNDAAESLGQALGFDWQVPQPALVQSLNGMANSAGLFSTAQIQALSPGARFLQRNPATGQFKLELSLKKAADLTNYVPFPFLAPQTTVTPGGKIEYLFTAPDNAALFRLEPQ